MKVERNERHIPESFGTDETALKTIKSSDGKTSIDSTADKFAKGSADKPSDESNKRSEIQHQVLGHEAKNEVSQFSQSKAAELTSKLGDSKIEEATKKFQGAEVEQVTKKLQSPAESGVHYSELTEILAPKSYDHNLDSRKTEVLMDGQLRSAQLHSQIDSRLQTDHNTASGHGVNTENQTSYIDKMKEGANKIGSSISNETKNFKETAEKLVRSGEVYRPIDLKDAGAAASEAISKAQKSSSELDEKMDPEKAVDSLKKDGDKYTISLGGSVGAPINGVPVKGGLKGTAELSKEKDGYKLTLDGEVAGALIKKKMGEVGAGGGVGGKVELSFKNEQEAKDAIRSLKQVVDVPENPYLAGGLKLNTNSLDNLGKYVKAVEVRGSLFVEGSLELEGGKSDAAQLKTLFGKGKVQADEAVRLEFSEGKPSKLIFKTSVQGEAAAGTAWKMKAGEVGVNFGRESSVSGKVTVTAEREIPLSPNADSKKLIEALNTQDPNKLKSADPEAFKRYAANQKLNLTVAGDVKVDQMGTGAGAQAEIKFSVNSDYLIRNRKHLDSLVNDGPTPETLSALGDGIEYEGKVEAYKYEGSKWTPGVSVGEAEAGVEMGYAKQEVIKTIPITKAKKPQPSPEMQRLA